MALLTQLEQEPQAAHQWWQLDWDSTQPSRPTEASLTTGINSIKVIYSGLNLDFNSTGLQKRREEVEWGLGYQIGVKGWAVLSKQIFYSEVSFLLSD